MAKYQPIPEDAEHWGKALLDAAFEVHALLDAGFLERVYVPHLKEGIRHVVL